MVTIRPLFGTQDRLTLDISIALYIFTPFFLFFSFLYFTPKVLCGRGTDEMVTGAIRPQRLVSRRQSWVPPGSTPNRDHLVPLLACTLSSSVYRDLSISVRNKVFL